MAYTFPKTREEAKRRLVRWRRIFFEQKYRFDLGQQFLTFINFTLLIVVASDKLQIFFGISKARVLILILVPFVYLGVWLFGWFMDKIVRAPQIAEQEATKRSIVWAEHNTQMNRIEQEILEIKILLTKSKRRR